MTIRVFRNLGANSSAMAVTMIGQLALVPVFLSCWSNEAYADWLVLMTLPSLLFMLNGGLGTITGVQLTLLVERDQGANAVRLFRRMLGLFLLVTGVLAFAVHVTPVQDGLFWLLKPSTLDRVEFGPMVSVLTAYLGLGLAQTMVRAIYRASEVEYVGVALQSVGRLLEYILAATVAILGGGLAEVALAMTAATALTTLVLALHSQRLSRAMTLLPLWPTRPVWRFFVCDGLPVIAEQVGSRVSQQGTLMLLNHLLDARAVLLVGTLQTVQRALSQLPMMLSWAHAPDITTAFARKQSRRLGRLVRMALMLSLTGGLGAGVAVMLAGPWLYAWWVRGADLNPGYGLFALLALHTLLLAAWWPLSVVLNATKHHRVWSWFYVVVVCGSLALLPPMVHWLGVVAPFALNVVTGVMMLVFVLWVTDRVLLRARVAGPWRAVRRRRKRISHRMSADEAPAVLTTPSRSLSP